jgi:hypothetical protein
MKRLLTSNIAGNVGQPIKSGTLEFLQDAYKELAMGVLSSLHGENIVDTVPRSIYGVGNSGAGSNYIISAGAILYNGEIYLVPATSFTASTGAVLVLSTSYFTDATADPVEMNDGNTYSVHQVRTIQVVNGNSSTAGYIADFSDMVAYSFDWVSKTMQASDTTQSAIFTSGTFHFRRQGNTLFISLNATFSGSYSSAVNAIGINLPFGYEGAFVQYHIGERHEFTTGTVDAEALRVQTGTSNTLYFFRLDNSNFPNPSTHPHLFTASLVIALA